jgi:type II secretory pathway pseudopilin PulG
MIDYLRQMPLLLQVTLLTAALLAVLSLAVVTRRARRQVQRLRQLADAIAAASRSNDTARALEAVLETVARATGARAGLVYLLDRPQGTFTLKGNYGPKDGVRRQAQWAEEGWPVLALGETACCEGWPAGPLGLCKIANRREDVTAAFAPLSSGDRLLGALGYYRCL